jgi:hypothetical protein
MPQPGQPQRQFALAFRTTEAAWRYTQRSMIFSWVELDVADVYAIVYMLPVKPIFYKYPLKTLGVVKISRQKIRSIEKSSHISVVEKVNLIALLLGYKWITDVSIGLYHSDEVKELLLCPELPLEDNQYIHETAKYEWIQVAMNRPILDYVIKRRDQLSVLEAVYCTGIQYRPCLLMMGYLKKYGSIRQLPNIIFPVHSQKQTPTKSANISKICGRLLLNIVAVSLVRPGLNSLNHMQG